jgi:hypothetical protein
MEVIKMSEKNYNVTVKDGILTLTIDLNQCTPQLTSTGRSATFFTTGKYYIPVEDNNHVEYGISFSIFTKDRYIIETLKSKNSIVNPLSHYTPPTPQQAVLQQVMPQQQVNSINMNDTNTLLKLILENMNKYEQRLEALENNKSKKRTK